MWETECNAMINIIMSLCGCGRGTFLIRRSNYNQLKNVESECIEKRKVLTTKPANLELAIIHIEIYLC